MVVHKLTPADANAFQSLCLLGLQECPAAFASSYEEECGLELPVVAERLALRNDRAMFGAFQEHELVVSLGSSAKNFVSFRIKPTFGTCM